MEEAGQNKTVEQKQKGSLSTKRKYESCRRINNVNGEFYVESGFLEYRFMIQGKNTGLYLESIKRKIRKNIRKDQTLKRNKKIKKTIRNE